MKIITNNRKMINKIIKMRINKSSKISKIKIKIKNNKLSLINKKILMNNKVQ